MRYKVHSKWRSRGGGSHIHDYERDKNGSLIVGPSCNSGPVLKKRFDSATQADKFRKGKKGLNTMKTYRCPGCQGYHLTTETEKSHG